MVWSWSHGKHVFERDVPSEMLITTCCFAVWKQTWKVTLAGSHSGWKTNKGQRDGLPCLDVSRVLISKVKGETSLAFDVHELNGLVAKAETRWMQKVSDSTQIPYQT